MSSDAFADLADGLDGFCAALREVMNKHRVPMPGSPAVLEAQGEPFAGDWGDHPSLEIFGTVYLTAWGCADHLAAAAAVLRAHRGVAALYTLMRGACESAAITCYLTDAGIDTRERLRRNFNCRLAALREQITMLSALRTSAAAEAAPIVARNRESIATITRTAARHGFTVTSMSDRRPACLGKPVPSTTQLIDSCAGAIPGFGSTSYRLLSSVAHGQLHGLSRFMMTSWPGPGKDAEVVPGVMNVDARTLAAELLAGPVCAWNMADGMCRFAGWSRDEVGSAGRVMHNIWSRVSAVPYVQQQIS